jgi:hypothetical protein
MQTTYTQAELNQARAEGAEIMRHCPEKREMRGGNGVLVSRIPKKLYFNAVTHHGVSPNDTEYWNDMLRVCPEFKVKYHGKIMVQMATAAPGTFLPRRNRFGRVSFRKVYR